MLASAVFSSHAIQSSLCVDLAWNNVREMGKIFLRVSIVLIHVSVKSLHGDHTVFSAVKLACFHPVSLVGLREAPPLPYIIILCNCIKAQFRSSASLTILERKKKKKAKPQ